MTDPRKLYRSHPYVRKFIRHYGRVGPYTCHFCGEEVWLLAGRSGSAGVVHHLDHDHDNDAIENLAPAHRRCHGQHHHAEREFSPEHRAKISASLRERGIRPPLGSGGRAQRGRPKSEAHKAAIAEGQRRRWARQRGESE